MKWRKGEGRREGQGREGGAYLELLVRSMGEGGNLVLLLCAMLGVMFGACCFS